MTGWRHCRIAAAAVFCIAAAAQATTPKQALGFNLGDDSRAAYCGGSGGGRTSGRPRSKRSSLSTCLPDFAVMLTIVGRKLRVHSPAELMPI